MSTVFADALAESRRTVMPATPWSDNIGLSHFSSMYQRIFEPQGANFIVSLDRLWREKNVFSAILERLARHFIPALRHYTPSAIIGRLLSE